MKNPIRIYTMDGLYMIDSLDADDQSFIHPMVG